METIAVDFDGVIHKYRHGWADGSVYDVPMEGSIEALNRLVQSHYVFIHSTRDPQQIVEWFWTTAFSEPEINFADLTIRDVVIVGESVRFWNVPYIIGVTNRKLPASVYVDDRGLRFTTWETALQWIHREFDGEEVEN